jgi:beta-glucanase (GH16 family)
LINKIIFTEDSTTICRVPIKNVSRISTALAFVLIFSAAVAINSKAATVSGTSCSQAGNQLLEGKKLFTCVKSGSKLMWKFTDDNTSAFAPFPLAGPSWLEIAQQKDLLEKAAFERAAKEAAELKAKRDAEIAAAVLKARLDAEAKAAKAEAEKPKIQGLTIGNLLWSDDFKGNKGATINGQNWSARNCHRVPASLGGGACFDAEVVYYAPSAIALDGSEDGAAVISTNRISGALPADAGKCLTNYCGFVSGRFDTHGKVAFQYGFIEARIKMPSGSGNHPAFWMLGDNINQVGWPTSGEMDITEIRGNEPTIATSATHYTTTYAPNTCCWNHQYKVASLPVGVDLSLDFHTYAVAWLPNSISYYVDGRLISTTTPQNLGGHWSFNDKFFLILNNAVSASFSGPWNNLMSSTMTIDWVRSYQLNGQGQVFTK